MPAKFPKKRRTRVTPTKRLSPPTFSILSVLSTDIVLALCQDVFDTEELVTGAELRKKRLAVGLSQEALARALSVSVSSVSKWESGARRIRPFAVHAIETVLTQLERHKLASQQHRLADLKQLRHRKGGEQEG
jgi:DNA-binding transcriptional regulator YiaG